MNGFNLGRYWTVKGPQKTLYVPSAMLKSGGNTVVVTELESAPCDSKADGGSSCYIESVSVPQIDGDVTPIAS